MTQAYSNPKREEDQYALPDVEVFYMSTKDIKDLGQDGDLYTTKGWYWWTCLPGCLPDSEPSGPFDTEEDALQDAQDID